MIEHIIVSIFIGISFYLWYVNYYLHETIDGYIEMISELSVKMEEIFNKVRDYEDTYGKIDSGADSQ